MPVYFYPSSPNEATCSVLRKVRSDAHILVNQQVYQPPSPGLKIILISKKKRGQLSKPIHFKWHCLSFQEKAVICSMSRIVISIRYLFFSCHLQYIQSTNSNTASLHVVTLLCYPSEVPPSTITPWNLSFLTHHCNSQSRCTTGFSLK